MKYSIESIVERLESLGTIQGPVHVNKSGMFRSAKIKSIHSLTCRQCNATIKAGEIAKVYNSDLNTYGTTCHKQRTVK